MQRQVDTTDSQGIPRRVSGWVLAGFLVVAAFFLLTEHRAHVFGVLPYVLLVACPLMHLFHHHGHRHSGHPPPASTSSGEPPA